MNVIRVLLLTTALICNTPVFSSEISNKALISIMKVSHLSGYCQAIFDSLDLAVKEDNKEAELLILKIYKYKSEDIGKTIEELLVRCNSAKKIHNVGIKRN